MCGIIAIARRRNEAAAVDASDVATSLQGIEGLLYSEPVDWPLPLSEAADLLEGLNARLCGEPGVMGLLSSPGSVEAIRSGCRSLASGVAAVEAALDDDSTGLAPAEFEATNAELIRCKDALWAIERDRLRAAEGIDALSPSLPGRAGCAVLLSLHQALSALDRLEVRGRDSAGIALQLTGHGLDPGDPEVAEALRTRTNRVFANAAVRFEGDVLVIVYKTAAEIGELGDNTAALRAAIVGDDLLHRALGSDSVEALVLGHTRWASIGVVSEANAHPQCSDEVQSVREPGVGSGGAGGPFATAVLNGDVDNYAELAHDAGLRLPAEVTTDAKVIPTLLRRTLSGSTAGGIDAFRDTAAAMEGSVAIAASTTDEPGRLYLALRGSGQALYVGLADDAYIVASEPYGVVEETPDFLRMDGETPSDAENPTGSRGQIVSLDAAAAGTLDGIRRISYDGTDLPVTEDDLSSAGITTRDIDRGEFPHFLLKEVTDSPHSFRTTLRGRLVDSGGSMEVRIGADSLPESVVERLGDGRIGRVIVIGQGTAAVAGQSLAQFLVELLAESDVRVEAMPATELSGVRMRHDMSDSLVVAISQSGTTTDTNRTVDLVRARGAAVVAIVNRRGSDLTDKADGVLYTADGRDVEMSVASTKAFYSQVAAGMLLAYGVAAAVPGAHHYSEEAEQSVLRAMRDLPARMEETLATRDSIASAAHRLAPSRRYWALVGNGVNQIAARELRIKLSELCYKSIACDATEDKKHIDLSSEPLILVCAAGLVGSTADDVAKEVAIFAAHKATPIVVASEGARGFDAAAAVLQVPDTHERLGFVLATMVGHLFGYEAALAIDAQAQPLREARAAIDEVVGDVQLTGEGASVDAAGLLARLGPMLTPHAVRWYEGMRTGSYNGHLEAGTALQLAGEFRYATGLSPLDGYEVEFGHRGTPGVVIDDLGNSLSAAIDELTRPVDAIKHQAKTVTVGISRSDEALLSVPLVEAALDTGAGRDSLPYSALRTLAELDPAIEKVSGWTRYALDGGDSLPTATIRAVDAGGIAQGITSRTTSDPRLRGTKALVARERELMVVTGRSDGRNVVIVPEIRGGVPVGLVLLHVDVVDRLPAAVARSVLQGYRRRYQALRDAVTETEDELDETILAAQPVIDLLVVPILDLADRWRS
jgi:glucosamine--fructose-6-phosphate aminotransferase (isomerizing)